MDTDYFNYKLRLIEKTYEHYISILNIYENFYFKIKYGCITIVFVLLGFRYTKFQSVEILNYIAILSTLGLWVFESTLRTTHNRYIVKIDLLTETINNNSIMRNAFENKNLDSIRVLDFDIRSITLKKSVEAYIEKQFSDNEQDKIEEQTLKHIKQKQAIYSLPFCMRIKNVAVYYTLLLFMQLLILVFFRP